MDATLKFKVYAVVTTPGEGYYSAPKYSRGELAGELTVPAHADSRSPNGLRHAGLLGDHLRAAGYDLPKRTLDRYIGQTEADGLCICDGEAGFGRAPMLLWLEAVA